MTSPVQRQVDISPAQREQYRADGAILLRGVLGLDEVDRLRAGLDAAIALRGPMTSLASPESGDGRTMLDQFSSHRVPELASFLRDGPAAGIAAGLLGVDTVQYVMDQSFCKWPGKVMPSPWHQDTPYMSFDGPDLVRTWISVDPAPAQIAIAVVQGSHLWGHTFRATPPGKAGGREEAADGFGYANQDFDQSLPDLPDIDGNPDAYRILSWDVEPGDIIAFDGRAVHGAGASDDYPHFRRAFAVFWAGPHVRYVSRPGNVIPDLSTMAGEPLSDGALLKDHTDIFPAL